MSPSPADDARDPSVGAVAERAHDTSEWLALLVRSVRDYAIFALDRDGAVVTWNEGARRLKGYEESEIVGRHFSTFYPREDVVAGKPARLLAAAERDGRVEDEGWRVRKDGSLFWADVVITALRSEDGTLRGFAKVTRDLTHRRLLEESVRQSEERLRLMVERVADYAIFMLEPDGTVATWNEGARRLKGYEPGEIIGSNFSVFYTDEDRAAGRPQRLLGQALADGRVEDEGWRVRKDGTRFWADVVITALVTPGGELRGFAKVTRDLTERREHELALRALADRERLAAAELRDAQQSRRNLIAMVAHDLRAPVTVLAGTAELLLEDRDSLEPEEQVRLLELMVSSGHRLNALVSDVLDVSRLEAGRFSFRVETVDLSAVVRRAARDLDPRGARIRVTCEDPLLACADEQRIWQVATNLMSNALKFSPAGAMVEVSCGRDGAMASVSVTDHGIGMSEDQQQRLFEPYARMVAEGGAASVPGSGLGLYIARSLVVAQGGAVRCVSAPGEGSTFTFTVPLAGTPAE